MFSPFEELEYLSDYLPEEGETVLLSRESGELVCKPAQQENLREGVENAELYGLLVQSNEQLRQLCQTPRWTMILALTALGITLHGLLRLSVSHWYLIPGLLPPALLLAQCWMQNRRRIFFESQIGPRLAQELKRRNIRKYALLAGVKQHQELGILFHQLVSWSPQPKLREADSF